ncbi:snaclec 1-like [Cyprinus carpio]|uniref:Snaclec 1-like n=1 Tax=Cyprinus carpio TaxID=7962 RepID=A0A9Q9XRW4_CYPCA|nr:snaclec 1-like [Cyprinus carpio]
MTGMLLLYPSTCSAVFNQLKPVSFTALVENVEHLKPTACPQDKLVLIRENKTWTEALRYCRDRDMDLVSVDSEQMQRWVMDVTSSALSDHVWLGLRHACALRFWFWVNGCTVCYNQWAPDYDTGLNDCDKTVRSGVIRTCDNRWISRPETDRYNFICIK